ncbi:MAG TPA: hypothetical protein VIO39_07490 [Methylotenera sp.]
MIKVAKSKNSLKNGYIYIPILQREIIYNLIGGILADPERVEIVFNDVNIGLKYVDHKYNRVAIGKPITKKLLNLPISSFEFMAVNKILHIKSIY